MIDLELTLLLEELARSNISLEVVADTLKGKRYADVMDWYRCFAKSMDKSDYRECASLLLFLHENADINFLCVENFSEVRSLLSKKFGINQNEYYSLYQAYQALLFETSRGRDA